MRDHIFYLISKYRVRADSRLGQNFLIVPDIIERNVERAELDDRDTVLEIGPGLGTMTDALSRKAGMVYAIEKDPRMVEVLRREYRWENVEIIEGDATKVELPQFNKVVSNLPYQISSPVTFRLLRYRFERAVLMYQLEFARRMVASPGDKNYSRLSVMVSSKARAELVEKIGRGAFWPKPKVDSAVVILEPLPADEVIPLNEDLVRALFQHRKSTVQSALKKSWRVLCPTCDKGELRMALNGMPHSAERVFHLHPKDILDIEEYMRSRGLLPHVHDGLGQV